jgi:diguanylate cyclase (GGDEF)-like protein
MRHIGFTKPECAQPVADGDTVGDTDTADCVECLRRCVRRLELDAMTGLARSEVVRRQLVCLARQQIGVLVFVDIDNLKAHNDRARSEGDRAIVLVSTAVSRCCRASDVAGREGGDEFLIGISPPLGGLPQSVATGERIAERVAAMVEAKSTGLVSVSAAICLYRPSTQGITEALDRALLLCKSQKQNKRQGLPAPFDVSHLGTA